MVFVLQADVGSQQFDRFLSPWARLLDWLSFRYRVLFLVSAGNHFEPVRVPEDVDLTDPEELQGEVLDFVRRNALSRRLLAPAESVNALTIGSTHGDASGAPADGGRIEPFTNDGLGSVVTPTASGFRRSIKPEALVAGGRQLLRQRPIIANGERVLEVVTTTRSPGVLAAAPPRNGGTLRERGFLCGTSGANALAVRGAFTLLSELDALRAIWGNAFPPAAFG